MSAQSGPYRIQVAAELCGVLPATLRAWERRYGVPVPRRSASAYRLYSAEDLELVRRMRTLVERGVSPSEAARMVLTAAPPVANDTQPAQSMADALELTRSRLLSATQRYDAAAIETELMRLSMLVDAQTLYEGVVAPLVVEVGQRWHDGTLSVAQEHLLTERLESTLRGALRTLERRDGPLVLLACVETETHVLGLLGAAIQFAAAGARAVVLGAVTPPSAIADAVRSMSPRVVGLSVATVPRDPAALFSAYAKACEGTPWLVGGAAAAVVGTTIAKAGGVVVRGPAAEWQPQIRFWLRGNP